MTQSFEVFAKQYRYLAAPEPTISRFALITGTVSDELFPGLPLRNFVIARANVDFGAAADPGFMDRVTYDVRQPGVFCFSGEATRAFPRRDLQPYSLRITLLVPGYRSAALAPLQIDANTAFPLRIGNVPLRAQPVSLIGQVTDIGQHPLAGVWVQVTGSANPPGAPQGQAAVLRTPLQAAFVAATPVSACNAAAVGAALALTAPAAQGATSLFLNQRGGLAVGQLMRLGAVNDGVYHRVAALPGPNNLNLPGEVRLNAPLAHSLPSGTSIQPVNVTNLAPLGQLTQDAAAGDRLALFDAALGFQANQTLLCIGDAATGELHLTGGLTDVQGYYRLEGISRARTLTIEAAQGGLTLPNPLLYDVNYAQAQNIVNLRLA
jgi:hypothetical protein